MNERNILKLEGDLKRSETGKRMQNGGRRSRKTPGREWLRSPCFPFAVLFLAVLLTSPVHAREDNARLVFQKTAGSGKSRAYVVKQGEWIAGILRTQFGNEPVSYALIRRLNPGIKNLNRIQPGQKIVLPVLDSSEPSDAVSEAVPGMSTEYSSPPVIYRILEGDSMSRIILSEMNVNPAEVLPAYRLIRKLNPEIPDLNRLPVGQTLRLPPAPARSAVTPPAPLMPATDSTEKSIAETAAILDSLLGIIRPVITKMRGAVTVTGSYYIPLQETTQITIDCAQIPVVELDDGTTVLLDYGDRLSENLKKLIRQTWNNYAFLAAEEFRDGFAGLLGIISHSRNYRMVRADKPVELTMKPEILIFPDWIITGKETAGDTPYRQGLFLLDRGERPLPADARAFLEKSGFAVTEIADGRSVSSVETPPVLQQPALADLRTLKGIALAEKLLAILGETSIRNAEVVVFDQARNGFNLTVTADLLVRKGEKRFIFHTKRLPEQFLRILHEAGSEVIEIGEKDQGRSLVEGVLQGLGIPVSFGYFSFRIPEEGKRTRLTASFSALRAMNEGESIYLIDFDMPSASLPFLDALRGGHAVRY
ncbi:MAG: LysM peptidoglycan-binding domain-containing protein [Deltaproteobacteria bacterium]|nr:LysM peptidoglycan-binding domain-containing protein [Deltaproteobacteria bacterium]